MTPDVAALLARKTDSQPPAVLQIVCAWHTPRPELDALNRQFPGQVSHGLCAACAARFDQEVA